MIGLLIANLVVSTIILGAFVAAGVTIYRKQRKARKTALTIGQGLAAALTQAAQKQQQAQAVGQPEPGNAPL